MANTSLMINIGANINGAVTGIKKVWKSADNLVQKSASLKVVKWGFVAGSAAAAAALTAIGTKLTTLGASAEITRLTFQTMLGSVENGNAMLTKLNGFANATPFSNDEIIKSAKSLMAFNVPAKEIESTLKFIGDASAGSGKKIEELSAIYGKVNAKGKADTEALNQMVEAGIPILDVLGKQMGATGAEIYDMASKGQIGASNIKSAFEALTSNSGVYANMMEKQSKTTVGLWSTIKGQIANAGANIGETFQPLIQKVLTTLSEWSAELVKFSTDGRAVTLISTIAMTAVNMGASIVKAFVMIKEYGYATFQSISDSGLAIWYGIQGTALLALVGIVKGFNHFYEQTKAVFVTIGRVATILWDSTLFGATKLATSIINLVLKAVNSVIAMLNKIPGVDIDTVAKPKFVEKMEKFAKEAGDRAAENIEKVASGADFKEANQKVKEKNAQLAPLEAEADALNDKSADKMLAVANTWSNAVKNVATKTQSIDDSANDKVEKIATWQSDTLNKLAEQNNAKLSDKTAIENLSTQAQNQQSTGAISNNIPTDSLSKIGLYNFNSNQVPTIDKERNTLLKEIRDGITSQSTVVLA